MRGHQEVVEVVSAVFKAAGFLHPRAAITAEVDFTGRHRGRATTGASQLEYHDISASVCRFDSRTGTRAAKADNRHISLKVPLDNIFQPEGPCGGIAGITHGKFSRNYRERPP